MFPYLWEEDDSFGPRASREETRDRIGLTVATVLGLVGAAVCIFGLGIYGWGLFVVLPGVVGFLAASPKAKAGYGAGACAVRGILAALLVGLGLLLFAWEGVICLVMAAPIWLPMAALGGALAAWLLDLADSKASRANLLVLFSLPSVLGAEYLAPIPSPRYAVTTAVDVQAPCSEVWRHVVSFGELPPPHELLFRAGIAYPLRAEIDGHGAGALRRCVFSTGAFLEPIEVWDEPRLLQFSVSENPPPMQELSPFGEVHAPHLHGFLVSERGEFRLIELEDGGTRLEGTTWYQHHLWPAAYWRLWSDAIIHRIHLRVLNHVKRLSEEPQLALQ